MTILFIPIASLSRSKSRLADCLTQEQRQKFTLALFRDLAQKIQDLSIFQAKIIYSPDKQILDLAENYDLIPIRETPSQNSKTFNNVIGEMDEIAISQYQAQASLIIFLDLPLITQQNIIDLHSLLKKNQVVISPAINSAGISALGRHPVQIIQPKFDDPLDPSLVALHKMIKRRNIKQFKLYDSLRTSFDVDIKSDLLLTYEYLRIFKLTDTNTFQFLENNLDFKLCKNGALNNRDFIIKEK